MLNTSTQNSSIGVGDFTRKMLQPFRWHLAISIFIASFWSFDLVIRPYLIKVAIDRMSANPGVEVLSVLALPVGLYVGLSLFHICIYRVYDVIVLKMMPQLRQNVINFMTSHMLYHSHSYFQNNFAGSLANKINDVALGLREIISIFIDRFWSHTLALIFSVIIMFSIHWVLASILLVWLILYLSFSLKCARRSHELSDALSETNSGITGKIVDLLSNMSVVRFFATAYFEKKNIKGWSTESVRREQTLLWFLFKLWLFQGLSFFIMEALSIAYMIYARQYNQITIGDFGLVLTLNIQLVDSLWNLSKDFSDYTEHFGRVTQGLRLTTAQVEIKDVEGANPLIVKKGEIRFDNVLFHYKLDTPLFQNLTVTINGGEKVGLVGFSGSGKSTFASLILRLFDVQKGLVLIDGQDVSKVTQESLRENIGMIPQDPTLFHRTLMENIRYGRLQATDSEVIGAAKQAHVHEFVQKMTHGYETMVGERGVKISGGQRQRVAIARAMLKNAPILILDEATSSLDSVTEELIQESLFELMKEKTTLVIAHRLSTLLYMDRILVFDKGAIVEDGTHEELLKMNGLYTKLWEAQISGFLPEYYGSESAEEEGELKDSPVDE
ncbi:ABC transporter ATP-binding protein [Candidatus Nucleicultrix amoebiphila]|uniref:ABC transporter ATP-binding protein n=1 Tax=Candidatus Nucleicultrix amoebiphila TaxID=1509244 RepID=UPI001E644684|nr:ABC transporter ATP-binding protein [Candidatus Nucleicultrix amoebiphila]